jgi:hypothetical protein
MDLLEALLMWEALLGCLFGLVAAGLIHWLAPAPEPVFLEAALVAGGFFVGLIVGWRVDKRDKESREEV